MADLDFFKNIQDWNCDLIYNNPGVKAVRPDLAEKCHKGAELVTNEAKDLVNNPAGYVAKKIADGTFNEILSSFWEGTVGVYKQFVTSWLHAGPEGCQHFPALCEETLSRKPSDQQRYSMQ